MYLEAQTTRARDALTTSIPAAEGAAGSFHNNQMKHIISKTWAHYQQEGAPPQTQNRWCTAWTAICQGAETADTHGTQ